MELGLKNQVPEASIIKGSSFWNLKALVLSLGMGFFPEKSLF